MAKKPTYTDLVAALGTLLTEYASIDELLDNVVAHSPEGLTPQEQRTQRVSNSARDRIRKVWEQALSV